MAQELTQPLLYDVNLVLKSAGLIAATTAETSVDLGGKAGVIKVIIDIDAIEIATDNEVYYIVAEGSSDDSAWVTLAALQVGAGAGIVDTATGGFSQDVDCLLGREILYFENTYRDRAIASSKPSVLRYIRLRTVVKGTIATGINYTAFATLVTHGG